MENKGETEVFAGNGADTIDKNRTMTDEEITQAQERLDEKIKNSKEYITKTYFEAWKRLDDKTQYKITEQDIYDLQAGKKLKGSQYEELNKEYEKVLKEDDEKNFKMFSQKIGGDMTENMKKWNAIKRAILIGVLFGMPGAIFMCIKDSIDTKFAKKQIKEAIQDFSNTNDKKTVENAISKVEKKFGNIIDVKAMFNNMMASQEVRNLLQSKEEIKRIMELNLSYAKDINEEINDFVENSEELEEQEEIEIEDEEDEAPVEGEKIFM